MKVREIMTRSVDSIDATESIARAAELMADKDVGVLPVTEGGRVIGIVTDRDIAVRAVHHGLHSGAPILRIMSSDVATCREEDEIGQVLEIMSHEQIRRLPVCDESGMLVGMITLADAARLDGDWREVAVTLSGICHPSGHHCQSIAAE